MVEVEVDFRQSQLDVVDRMSRTVSAFYVALFQQGVGSYCHSFIEFVGLMSEYLKIVHRLAEAGEDLQSFNVHSGKTFSGIQDHEVLYLAEKLGCIFAPMLRGRPELRPLFVRALFAEMGVQDGT